MFERALVDCEAGNVFEDRVCEIGEVGLDNSGKEAVAGK